jgi:hypothetical protein
MVSLKLEQWKKKNRLTTIAEGGWAFFQNHFCKNAPNKSLWIKDFFKPLLASISNSDQTMAANANDD